MASQKFHRSKQTWAGNQTLLFQMYQLVVHPNFYTGKRQNMHLYIERTLQSRHYQPPLPESKTIEAVEGRLKARYKGGASDNGQTYEKTHKPGDTKNN